MFESDRILSPMATLRSLQDMSLHGRVGAVLVTGVIRGGNAGARDGCCVGAFVSSGEKVGAVVSILESKKIVGR